MENKYNVVAHAITTIHVPIDKVWQVLAEDFSDIGKWASGVNRSVGIGDPSTEPKGRMCEISAAGFGDTTEKIITYNATNHVLSYSLYGLPGFVEEAINTWKLKSSEGVTTVSAQTRMRATGLLGYVMKGIMRKNTKKALTSMCEELKYYLEEGQPHPKKLKKMQKYEKKQAKSKQPVSEPV